MTPILKDAAGQSHAAINWQTQEPRIVSLVPSITELLFDLDLEKWLVGRTGFCIHPKSGVSAISKVGGTKTPKIQKIRDLHPTHLIVNIDENEKAAVAELATFIPHVIVTHPLTAFDNLDLYRLLGNIFVRQAQAEQLCKKFQGAFADLKMQSKRPEKVLYCIWRDPWMTVAPTTYISNMLSLIEWQTWPNKTHQRYPVFNWEEVLSAQIDIILLSSEPYRFNRQDVFTLQKKIAKKIYLVDGEMISWYGSRAILGLQYLMQLAML